MTWWQALILGIVEGLTEYLPVSSTGHLILTAWLLGLGDDPAQWQAAFSFNIVIQLGAIIAVLGLYRQRVWQISKGMVGQDPEGLRLGVLLLLAFLPAAVLGLLLKHWIDAYLNGPWPVVGALFVGAWLMLAVAWRYRQRGEQGRTMAQLTWQMALLIGLAQCVAMWPGTSRSMMTIVAALMLGMKAREAAEFSFLLGLVTLTAATGYEMLKEGQQIIGAFGLTPLLIGLISATLSAAFAVQWFVGFLNRKGLAPFGWYRLALACVVTGLLLAGVLTVPAGL